MPFVSYAQNFEDVILWRALKHVGRGFYIDVGAQDPVIDSVSLAFYEQGWRGVHVEPVAEYAEKLRQERPDEEVIQAAVASHKRELVFYEIPETGLSTGSRPIAMRHRKLGYPIREVSTPCVRLSAILDHYHDRDIHWLKIDVEGMEGQVIRSWAPSRVRPWVVTIESTEPNSQKPSFCKWEPLLTKLGYEFVYFDGLNRFYVSRRHPELKGSFGPGPSIFDNFLLSGLASQPFCTRLNSESAVLRRQLAEQQASATALTEAVDGLRAEHASQGETFAKAVASWENATAGLKTEIAARDQVISSRDQRLAALNVDLTRLSETQAQVQQRLVEREEETDELARAVEVLRAEATAQVANFASAVAAWESAAASLQGELDAKKEMLSAREQRVTALECQVVRHREEVSKLQQQLVIRTDESQRLSKAFESARADAAAQAESLAKMSAIWGSEISRLNDVVLDLRRQLSIRSDALTAGERRLATLDSEFAHLSEEAAQLRQQVAEQARDLADKAELLAGHHEEIATLSAEVAHLNAEAAQLRKQATEQAAGLAKGAEQLGARDRTLAEQQAELPRLSSEVEQLRAQLAERTEKAAQLTQAAKGLLSEAYATVAVRDERICKFQQEVALLVEERSRLREQLADRQRDIERLRAEHSTQLVKFDGAVSEWARARMELAAELASEAELAAASERQVAALKARLAQLDEEDTNLRRQLTLATEESARLAQIADDIIAANALQSERHAEATAAWVREISALRREISTRDETIAARNKRIAAIEAESARFNIELSHVKTREASLNRQLASYRIELDSLHQMVENQKTTGEVEAATQATLRQELELAQERLAGIYASTSWHITAPLRFVGHAGRRLSSGLRSWLMPRKPTPETPRALTHEGPPNPGLDLPNGIAKGPSVLNGAAEEAPLQDSNSAGENSPQLNGTNYPFFATASDLDLGAEPEGVREMYRRLLRARAVANGRGVGREA